MARLSNPAGRVIVLFRVRGVEVGFTPSWLVMVTFLSVAFEWSGTVPDGIGRVAGAAAAVGLALAFYVSVLLHEGAHTAVAHVFGLQPKRIVLFLLGGVSQIARDAEQPKQEYLVALAGPLVSLLLGGVFAAIARLSEGGTSKTWGTLAYLNIFLAAFNMIPGFPLDGGRVLRATIWAVGGNRSRATHIAAMGGRVVAAGLAAGGVVYMLAARHDLGSVALGIWYIVLGYFLFSHASFAEREDSERQSLREQALLDSVAVAEAEKSAPLAPDIVPTRSKSRLSPPARMTRRSPPTTLDPVPALKSADKPPAIPAKKSTVDSPKRRAKPAAGTAKPSVSAKRKKVKSRPDEGNAAESEKNRRRVGRQKRGKPAQASSAQSGNRARHSRKRSSDSRGTARRGR
ncbi:MAG: hypothetical protein NVSMB57_03980 [Actinomycetota bacterium]